LYYFYLAIFAHEPWQFLFSVNAFADGAAPRRFSGTFFHTTMGGGVSISRANADDDENVKFVQKAKRQHQLREIKRERELDALAAKDKALLAMSKRALRREVLSSRAQHQAEIDRLNAARRDNELRYYYNESALKDREREVRELRRLVNILGDEKVALESAVTAAEGSKVAVAATATECQANLAKRDEIIADLRQSLQTLQERSTTQDSAQQQLEIELQRSKSESRGAIAQLTAELDATGQDLVTSQSALKSALEDIEGARQLVKAVMEQADRRVYEEQKRHSDVSFLRAKLVALYRGEYGEPGLVMLLN
jgi:chromosome segregation ATPase